MSAKGINVVLWLALAIVVFAFDVFLRREVSPIVYMAIVCANIWMATGDR